LDFILGGFYIYLIFITRTILCLNLSDEYMKKLGGEKDGGTNTGKNGKNGGKNGGTNTGKNGKNGGKNGKNGGKNGPNVGGKNGGVVILPDGSEVKEFPIALVA
jgi:hypothetical protein